eukprot:CAMPEP_0171293102 /NCGR_PEP_ID=MMETSP0816-20121228/1200_1 /TAXON_ID=420281 /ORGANISM="Proboscia inermis, Strain CCAP1064/1" /LENGTH=285 /DNA_ID=CAMNT_0011763545 /DNA_START=342 /DNA_END=1203 /DNA_ORIENTATION=-
MGTVLNAALETNNNDDIPNSQTEDDDEDEYTLDEVARYLSTLRVTEHDPPTTNPNNNTNNTTTNDEESIFDPTSNDLDQLFTPLDGTNLYSLACKMNHSCVPNVLVRYQVGFGPSHPLVLTCVAIREIPTGDPLCIRYIFTDGNYEEQRKELESYGFEFLFAAAIGMAQVGGGMFVIALQILDCATALGLPIQAVDQLLAYVTHHCDAIKMPPAQCIRTGLWSANHASSLYQLPNYCNPSISEALMNRTLLRPIWFPMPDVTYLELVTNSITDGAKCDIVKKRKG